MTDDGSDAVLYIDLATNHWAGMCCYCEWSQTFPGRDRAHAWDCVVHHLGVSHGTQHTLVKTINQAHDNAKQLAFDLVFSHAIKRRTKQYGATEDHA